MVKGIRNTILVGLLSLFSLSLRNEPLDITYKLQLAFIEKFTHFIKWPKPFKDEFVIAIYGSSPFKGKELQFYNGINIQSHPIKIINSYNLNNVSNANVLYLCDNKFSEIPKIKEWAKSKNILTISNKTNAAKNGVMINFYEENDKVRFEINYDVLQDSGFRISSKLLKLARIVD